MGGDFRTVLIEGDFYEEGDTIKARSRGQIVDVGGILAPLVGEEIQMAIHYVPPNPPDPTKWGGGCCNLQETGKCPAGHDQDPYRILNVHGQGVFRCDPTSSRCPWWLEKFDGTRQDFPLYLLIGHHARLVAATVFDVERMRDSIGPDAAEKVENMGVRVENLKDILERMKSALKEK